MSRITLTEEQKKLLWLSLRRGVEIWLTDLCNTQAVFDTKGKPVVIDLPYVGNDTADHMTSAAISVLTGILDAQNTAIENGYLKHN